MIQFRFLRLRLAFCLLGLMAAIPGYAAVVTSTGSGNWSNAATWDVGVPTAGDDVVIAEGHTINASGTLEFATLLIEDATVSGDPVGVLTVSNATLTGTVSNSGVLNVNGNITIESDVTNDGTLNWNNGSLVGASGGTSILNNAAFNINVFNGSITEVNFVNQSGGQVTKAGALNQTQVIPTSFVNEAGATLTVEAGRGLNFSGASFTNSGDVVVEGGLTFSGASMAINTGSTISGVGITTLSGANTVAGTADFVPATTTVTHGNGSLTSTSGTALAIPAATTYNFSNAIIGGFSGVSNNGTLNVIGNITIESDVTNDGTLNWNNGSLVGASGGTSILNNAAFNINVFNGSITEVNFVNQSGGQVTKSGPVNQTQTIPTSFVNEAGATLTVEAGRGLIFSGASFTNSGDVVVEGGLTFSGASMTVNTGSTISGGGGVTFNGANTVAGTSDLVLATPTVTHGNGSLTSTSGTALVIPAATTYNFANAIIGGFSGVSNSGTLNVIGNITIESDVTNDGTLNWNNGSLVGASGGTSILNNAAFNFNVFNGSITEVNFVNQSGGQVTKSGPVNQTQTIPTSFVNEAGATLTVEAGRGLNFSGASFTNSGDAVVEGNLLFTNASMTINTGSTISGGGGVTFNGANTVAGTSDLVLATPTVTHGNGSLTSTSGTALVIPAATTYNFANAIIGGFSGVSNSGVLNVIGNITIESDVTNDGTLNWNNGWLIGASGGTSIFNNAAFNINIFNSPITEVNFVNQSGGQVTKSGPVNQTQTIPTSFVNEAGATLMVEAGRGLNFSGTSVNNGSIVNDGSFTVSGTMTGTGTISGNTLISSTGTLAPGLSPGCMSFTNLPTITNTLNIDGTLEIEANGTTACSNYDQITVAGNVDLAQASLTGNLTGSFNPGDILTIIDAAAIVGTIPAGNITLPTDWGVQYDFPNAGQVSLEYTGPPTAALDFNVDTKTAGPGNTVIIPIWVNNFFDIVNYQGTIVFDPAVLTFVQATSPQTGTPLIVNNFGNPGQGTIPTNSITFLWADLFSVQQTLADGSFVMNLEFTVNANATTGFTPISIDGSVTPLGYSDDPNGIVLLTPTVQNGGVNIDADPPVTVAVNIESNNANDITLATVGDVITLTFTTDEAPAITPVVTITKGGAGAVTVTGSGTSWTATKTVAAGDDGLVTFDIELEDQYGNTSNTTATTDGSSVTVDTEAPVITCPANVPQDTDAGVCGADVTYADATATDNLAGVSVAHTGGPVSGSTFSVGTTAITYEATDAAGNTSTCSFDVIVTDNEAPTVVTQPVTVQLDAAGSASVTAAQVNNGSSDACGIATYALDITSFDCSNTGANTVTLTVTDNNGNVSTGTAVVTVEDNIAPTIVCPGPQTLDTDLGLCTATLPDLTGLATASDNCAGSGGSNGYSAYASTVSVGYQHTVAIAADGTLWAWGKDDGGQVGDGPGVTSNQFAPVQISTDNSWIAVSAGNQHNLALKSDGTVWAWGYGGQGQLGNGSTANQFSPVQVGSDTDWALIKSGHGTAFGIKSNGTLWAWGENTLGQLGIGNTIDQSSPVQVGTASDWLEVQGGLNHTVGVKTDGTLWTWGNNYYGQLGTGSGNSTAPVQVGSATDWAAVEAAYYHSIALKSDGTIWTWGSNQQGQLGIGNTNNQSSPVQVGSATDWTSLGVAYTGCYALKSNGSLWAWGARIYGAIGDGNTSGNQLTPIQIGTNTNWTSIADGHSSFSTLAFQSDGSLYGWGWNTNGQLGLGNATFQPTPVVVPGFVVSQSSNSGGSGSGPALTQLPAAGSALAVGANTVTITATDASGNATSCSVIVTVEDNEDPTVVTQPFTAQLDATGNVTITPADVDNASSDPCGIASYSLDVTDFTCSDVGANTVTLTVTDVNGNSSTGTAVVTVEDNVAPTVVTQPFTAQLDATGNVTITPADVNNGSSDACGIASYALDVTDFTCADVGTPVTVTLTVTDNNNNVSTGTAVVTVEDNVAPNVVTQPFTAQLDATGNVTITPADVNNGSSDACGIASYSLDVTDFTCSDVGANTVTLTAIDVNGNSASATAVVTVEDNVAPVVLTQPISVDLDGNGTATITPAQIDNGSSDACGIASYALDINSFDCTNVGANTVTLTVTDNNNNVNSATAVVTVNLVPAAAITGQAATEDNKVVAGVTFDVNGTDGPLTQLGSPAYSFLLTPCTSVNDIGGFKNNDASPINGVDVQDITKMTRHILNIEALGSPYKLLAADVNHNSLINGPDVTQVRQLVLGIRTGFPTPGATTTNPVTDDYLWTFIPQAHTWVDNTMPWTYPTRIDFLDPVNSSGNDFVGVKLGDVNNTWDETNPLTTWFADSIHMVMQDQSVTPGQLVTIPVMVRDFNAITGYQFTMNWDPGVLSLEAAENTELLGFFNTELAKKGILSTVWNDLSGQPITLEDDAVAFTLTFRVVGDWGAASGITVTSDLTNAIGYNVEEMPLAVIASTVNITVGEVSTSIDPSELEGYAFLQNAPNPFNESTTFTFALPKQEDVKIEIYNAIGQIVRTFEGTYGVGVHELQWDGANSASREVAVGVYSVRIQAGIFQSAINVKKMQ